MRSRGQVERFEVDSIMLTSEWDGGKKARGKAGRERWQDRRKNGQESSSQFRTESLDFPPLKTSKVVS